MSSVLIFCSRPLMYILAGEAPFKKIFPSWSTYKPGVLSNTSNVFVLEFAIGSGSIIILSSSCVIIGRRAVTVTSFNEISFCDNLNSRVCLSGLIEMFFSKL